MRTLATLNRSDLDKKLGYDLKDAYQMLKKEETSSSPTHVIINHCFIEIHKSHPLYKTQEFLQFTNIMKY